jgi:hypothetical protein
MLCISGVRGQKKFYQPYTTSFPLIAINSSKRLAQLRKKKRLQRLMEIQKNTMLLRQKRIVS